MDLADFIEANLEALIDDWAEYAMVLNQGKHRLTAVELRNSGAELLTRVAANMRRAQTPRSSGKIAWRQARAGQRL